MTWVDNAFFAPESLMDDRGRRIMWAWIFDGREPATRGASGWSGTMSLPRVLWLGDDATLRMAPPEELEALRSDHHRVNGLVVEDGETLMLEAVTDNSLELSLIVGVGDALRIGVKVCASPDGQEETLVAYDAVERQIRVDTTRSSLGEGPKSVEAAPFELHAGEPLRLRVFVDRSVVEVFANDRQAVMRRVYPTRPDSVAVQLFSWGGRAVFDTVDVWRMAPSNPW